MSNKFLVFIKYTFKSLSTSLVDYLGYILFLYIFEESNIKYAIFFACICARIISSSIDYFLNEKLIFKTKGNKKPQMIKHYVVTIVQMILSAVLVTLTDNTHHWNKSLEKCAIDTILFLFAYFLEKYWVFK